MTKHLWQSKHAFDCNPKIMPTESKAAQRKAMKFDTWMGFTQSSYYDNELRENLLFRWDWRTSKGKEGGHTHRLQLFFMVQRFGDYRSIVIAVEPEDEPEIRTWLQVRFDYLMALWAPFSPEASTPAAKSPPQ